jgi:gamma-glutamyl-gamma-aminobutyrate hydrolase PuuD
LKTLYNAIYQGNGYPFNRLVDESTYVLDPAELISRDGVLVIWGGADISPDLYNHPVSRRCAPYAGRRDRTEWDLLQEAIRMQLPIIGVCRGAQMLCAAAGGYLLQDVNNHIGGHNVLTRDGKKFHVNSIHHQMMAGLENTKHELVAWAEHSVGAPYIYRDDQTWEPPAGWVEPEFVYFPEINGYAIQWHPEGMDDKSEATKYVLDFIRQKEAARYEPTPELENAA